MNSLLKMCRVCQAASNDSGDVELVPIFEKSSQIAYEIFLICDVKIVDNKSHVIPALICRICIKDLSTAIEFRKRCRESDEIFKTTQGSESSDVKQEIRLDGEKIKDEPSDDFNVDLFENIDTILEENLGGVEESNAFAGIACNAKNEESTANTSDSESDFEEFRERKRKSKHLRKKSMEFDVINPSDGIAQCKLCFKTFTSLHSMKDHMRAIHQNLDACDMFKCPHCDRLFKMKYYLNRHIKSFHMRQVNKEKRAKNGARTSRIDGDEIFKEKLVGLNCPYCNKFLTSKHSLNDHIRVRHEFINFSERFLCDICGKDFPLKYYLLRHIRASHLKTLSYKKKNEDHLPCSICGKILKSKGNLSTHEKTHRILSPDEYWYCDICGNKFKGRGEMTVHIKKRHLYKIRYPCEICPNKSWRTLFQLQRHVKVFHNNIREFKCEWCGKEFGEKNKLVCHVRIHTGEQPFKCNFAGCSRAFTHQTDLRRHVWGHTGERPYKCQNQACLKGFMKKSELTAHESRCHPVARPSIPMPFQYQMM